MNACISLKFIHWNINPRDDSTGEGGFGRLLAIQYATGDQWGNNFRKNEEMETKQKQHPVVDVTVDGSKVWCCK